MTDDGPDEFLLPKPGAFLNEDEGDIDYCAYCGGYLDSHHRCLVCATDWTELSKCDS